MNNLDAIINKYLGMPGYYIIWTTNLYTEEYDNALDWDGRLDELVQFGPWDLNINGNICIVDDGDFED